MLEAAYYILLLACVLIIGAGFSRAMRNTGESRAKTKRFLTGYYIFISIWIGYTALLAFSGILDIDARPPRVPMLIILPAFALIAYFFTAKRFQNIIESFPFQLTVYYQSFRIFVELLILGAYIKGLGPVHATFEGYNFDILAGITAPIIGWLTFHKKVINMRGLLFWNITCLLLANIVMIFITLMLKPDLWGFRQTPISPRFLELPYIFIAAFYMPSAVFMHIFCIRKITLAGKKQKQPA